LLVSSLSAAVSALTSVEAAATEAVLCFPFPFVIVEYSSESSASVLASSSVSANLTVGTFLALVAFLETLWNLF